MRPEERNTLIDNHVPRITGLLVIEIRASNPNGDPEREGSPRQRPDGKGEISPVSFKRKLRDLVEQSDGQESPVWTKLKNELDLGPDANNRFQILESRGRNRNEIKKLLESDFSKFKQTYWDARLFGNTFLEEGGKDTIRSGVVQFGVGVSVASIEITFQTWTNKSGVQKDKDRGMAPLAFRVVKHGVYTLPFFVNPTQARKTGCTPADVKLMLHLLKYAYTHTRSVVRAEVEILHAHAVEHRDPLGSFSDFALLDALAPRRVPDAEKDKPSESRSDYILPTWEDIKCQPVHAAKTAKWSDVGDYTNYAL